MINIMLIKKIIDLCERRIAPIVGLQIYRVWHMFGNKEDNNIQLYYK